MSDAAFKTLSLFEAANFLGIHKETARNLAAAGKLPGAKVGRSWRFLEQDLVTHLRSLYSNHASQGVVNHGSKTTWHSTKETKHIGLTSTKMVCEYNEALGLATR
ncbi:MAG: hypothetical protein A3C44_00670 [Gammaproteobacteria bacterium RIFCSPHIGHO2_02_FULL_39_13]|nr:MAG: hypothetical protein A3C44_00670 [Gammaproteobacteria bacterium RIFCSPHIGHO2_02_FULL_39_13]OGT49907.1 MAG: hypothetical protein A3E53_02875 [Gammaproteobacteria bacterium RIFCSPHIGHO2_12_FULL_39_24]